MRGELRVWAAVAVAALAASVLPAAAAAAVTTAKAAPFDSTPAEQALVRLIGQSDADQVSLQAVSKTNGQDFFNISASGTQVVISGTTPAVQLTGVGWYLKYVAHADIGLDDSQLTLPAQLPLPAQPIHHSASVANRFALNDTNEGYSNPYLSWPQGSSTGSTCWPCTGSTKCSFTKARKRSTSRLSSSLAIPPTTCAAGSRSLDISRGGCCRTNAASAARCPSS